MDALRTENNEIYAVVKYTDDYLFNNDEMIIWIFYTEKEYKEAIEEWNELQEHTGSGWKTIWKKQS